VGNKYLPSWAHTETAEQLSERWVKEFENGIEGTGIKPGFIKISVDAPPEGLSDLHKKLVRAAAITHKRTGLTINSHTGPAAAAFEEIDILKKEGVRPDAFVWVHAQNEQDKNKHVQAAKMGAWVSLDNISNDFDRYADILVLMKKENMLNRVLISHDSGYYRPDEPGGGEYTGYTAIFSEFFPRLANKGFTTTVLKQLLVKNPSEAMAIRVRV
jgi:phosphotriesterase-related protein